MRTNRKVAESIEKQLEDAALEAADRFCVISATPSTPSSSALGEVACGCTEASDAMRCDATDLACEIAASVSSRRGIEPILGKGNGRMKLGRARRAVTSVVGENDPSAMHRSVLAGVFMDASDPSPFDRVIGFKKPTV